MTVESFDGEMWIAPSTVQYIVYEWFRDYDEWPTPKHLHEYMAERFLCPVEFANYDTLNALEKGVVYGLPSVVAMRLGEALGDWKDGLPPEDTGWRIAVREDQWGVGDPWSLEWIYDRHMPRPLPKGTWKVA